jgi:hypothetical protein
MKSFGLLRTNVGLTTNIKIMVDSNYNLSLDSIDSTSELSDDKFKNVKFNKDNYYDELIPYFYKDLPKNIAFFIKNEDNELSSMSDDFSLQYNEIYNYGARNIVNNKDYSEEYEYFAPLYIGNTLPKNFIIFRVDGAGLGVLNKDTFESDIIKNLKFVKSFNLTLKSKLGEWFDRNFNNNEFFPKSPLEIDFRNLEFSSWNGIEYKSGGYISKTRFIEDILGQEREIFEMEKLIFDSYQESGVVFPNILNMSFLFDDTPSNENEKRKWSLNRYLGFYLDDMVLHQTISPYSPPKLKDGLTIENNVFSPSEVDPFVDGYSQDRIYYVEHKGNYYKVETFQEQGEVELNEVNNSEGFISEEYITPTITKWKVIAPVEINDINELNNNHGVINSDKVLVDENGTPIDIEGFDDADIWLIEIDGICHNLVKEDGEIKLVTDYSFEFNENDFRYKVAGIENKVQTIVDKNNDPVKFNIYKLSFSDIRDFDTNIVDTEYSKYEYEKKDELTQTDETKMYVTDLNSNSNPKDLDDFVYNGEVTNIPVSSEYTANYETFKITDNNLSPIWNINPIYCRWVYQNSLSANDYPYLLNNSEVFEEYNRTVNPFESRPIRSQRNLDYFYTINSSSMDYIHHSLHVEGYNTASNVDDEYKFDLNEYVNGDYDYFDSFFNTYTLFDNGNIKRNIKKYSEFNKGDKSIPNSTLFKGIEFYLYNVESINLDDIKIINFLFYYQIMIILLIIMVVSLHRIILWSGIRLINGLWKILIKLVI